MHNTFGDKKKNSFPCAVAQEMTGTNAASGAMSVVRNTCLRVSARDNDFCACSFRAWHNAIQRQYFGTGRTKHKANRFKWPIRLDGVQHPLSSGAWHGMSIYRGLFTDTLGRPTVLVRSV